MAYIYKTNTTPTLATKATLSFWFKRGNLTVGDVFLFDGRIDANNRFKVAFNSADILEFWSTDGGSMIFQYESTRKFRDPNAWMHICLTFDTTESDSADRIKVYINGVLETAWGTESDPPLNDDNIVFFESGAQQTIGAYWNGSGYSYPFGGSMSHVHFVDGTAYQASTFGETDATSGIWKIKTSPSITYGTNGFFLAMEDRTNLDLDSSTNAHTFTTGGTLTPTYDSPSNNFATFNFLDRHVRDTNNAGDFLGGENGNLTLDSTSGMLAYVRSTIGVTAGKWYWELKRVSGVGDLTGICYGNYFWNATGNQPWDNAYYQCADFSVNGSTGYYYWSGRSGDSVSHTDVTASTGDILGFALDMTNSALYIHHNGTYFDGVGSTPGVPTSGATKTGDMLGLLDSTDGVKYVNYGQEVFALAADVGTGETAKIEANFGNGYFGTTAVSSTNADDAGIGSFEYDVPAGYYALCTKNIKAYGG